MVTFPGMEFGRVSLFLFLFGFLATLGEWTLLPCVPPFPYLMLYTSLQAENDGSKLPQTRSLQNHDPKRISYYSDIKLLSKLTFY